MRTYIWGSGPSRQRHYGARASVVALSESALCRASRPLLLPYGIIVLLVRGLGPVPFVHDGSGSFSRRGARFAFRPEGIWWIDGLWPAICLMIWESVSDVGLRL